MIKKYPFYFKVTVIMFGFVLLVYISNTPGCTCSTVICPAAGHSAKSCNPVVGKMAFSKGFVDCHFHHFWPDYNYGHCLFPVYGNQRFFG